MTLVGFVLEPWAKPKVVRNLRLSRLALRCSAHQPKAAFLHIDNTISFEIPFEPWLLFKAGTWNAYLQEDSACHSPRLATLHHNLQGSKALRVG